MLPGFRSRWMSPRVCASSTSRHQGDVPRDVDRSHVALPSQPLIEALALEQLHHEIGRAVLGLAHVVDVDDGGMPDLSARARLEEKPVERVLVLAQLGEQELHGEVAVGKLVASRPHRSHAPSAKTALQPVLAGDEIASFHDPAHSTVRSAAEHPPRTTSFTIPYVGMSRGIPRAKPRRSGRHVCRRREPNERHPHRRFPKPAGT